MPQSRADTPPSQGREKGERRVTQRRRVAERFTYRLHPVPPRVPRGMSGNSPAPAEGETPSGLPRHGGAALL